MKYSWFASYTVLKGGALAHTTAEVEKPITHDDFIKLVYEKYGYNNGEIVFTCVNCVPIKELLH